jgi:hypothetical protein
MLILFNNYNNNNNLLSLAINITYQNQYITSPTEKKINPNIILILLKRTKKYIVEYLLYNN